MKRPVLTQITQIYAEKRQVGLIREMDLLKQMPQIYADKDSYGTDGVYVVCILSAIICVICERIWG